MTVYTFEAFKSAVLRDEKHIRLEGDALQAYKEIKKEDKKSGGRLLGGAAVGLLLGGPIGALMGAAAGTAANGVKDLTKGKKLDEKYPDNYNIMLQFEKYYKKTGEGSTYIEFKHT